MIIAVDIDGTLCWSNFPVFLDECNTLFNLNIDQEILTKLESKEEFYAIPEVQALKKEREYIEDELAWIEYREKCTLASLLMDDAVEGIEKLSDLGDIAYYTARYCDTEDIQHEIKQSTETWLKDCGFKNNTRIVFCDRIRGKVLEILKLAYLDTILLVDDSYRSILYEIEQLEPEEQQLLIERLMIVAMRANASELPVTNVKVIALPYWDEIDSVIGRIEDYGNTTKATNNTGTKAATRDA